MVYIVGAGPGEPDLITVKGLRILKKADVVLTDHLAHPHLLSYCQTHTKIIDVGKEKGNHSTTQKEINEHMVTCAKAGKTVVRLKGGDPFIFGRLGEEMEWLTQQGIGYEVVPGVSSAIAGPGYAGIPLTHRQISRSVAFMTGTQIQGKSAEDIPNTDTLVCLMGYHQLETLIPKLLASPYHNSKTPIALLSKTTYPDQEALQSTLGNIIKKAKQHPLKTPVLLIIGEVVSCAKTCAWFHTTVFQKRLILCRQTGSCEHWLVPLQNEGLDVIHAPIIETQYDSHHGLTQALIKKSDLIIFTSSKGVQYSIKALLDLGLDSRYFAKKTILSLGPQVTTTLQENGLNADIEATSHNQAGVIACLPTPLMGKTILYPTSNEADNTLKETAEAAGAIVYQAILYKTTPRLCNYLNIKTDDWIVVFSPSVVASFLVHKQWPKTCLMIALGKRTETALKKAGFSSIKTLENPKPAALIRLIKQR